MNAGDKVRVQRYVIGIPSHTEDYIIEEFRHCLGFFESSDHKKAGVFTPLCSLFERGPESRDVYISNFGEYYTNPVQGWMNIT